MSWKDQGEGPRWVPVLNQAEESYGIPTDLLARVAYQESSFRPEVIDGTTASPAGALGIMQLMPQFFPVVKGPVPFSPEETEQQIDEAARYLASLFESTHDWKLALAAYNAGLGNVRKYNGIPPFAETQNYVAQITADVPVGNV